MKCRYCDTVPPDGARFCMTCGKPLPRPKPDIPEFSEKAVIEQVPPVLGVKAAAGLLGVSEWMVRELVRQNKIPYFNIGTKIKFKTYELLAWEGTLQGPITTAG